MRVTIASSAGSWPMSLSEQQMPLPTPPNGRSEREDKRLCWAALQGSGSAAVLSYEYTAAAEHAVPAPAASLLGSCPCCELSTSPASLSGCVLTTSCQLTYEAVESSLT